MKRFDVLFLANIMQSAELFLRAFLSTHLVAADPSGKFRGTKEVAREGRGNGGNGVGGVQFAINRDLRSAGPFKRYAATDMQRASKHCARVNIRHYYAILVD